MSVVVSVKRLQQSVQAIFGRFLSCGKTLIDGADFQASMQWLRRLKVHCFLLDLQVSMRWSLDGRVAIEVVDLRTAEAVERWWKMSSWR